jgi:anti-anti-sigma factor
MGSVSRVVGCQAAPEGENGNMGATVDFPHALQLELAYQVAGDGRATVRVTGELDIATADQAYAYLRDVVDSQAGPVTMNLAELTFCDAAGLGVLARVAGYAKRSGRSLKLTAARPSLLRIMRITGMDEAFPEVRSPSLSMIAWPRQASPTTIG